MRTTLTIEQSAELIKRGVSEDKASVKCPIDAPYRTSGIYIASVFTLADLLSLLPKHIRTEHHHYYLQLQTFVLTDEANPIWIARYITNTAIILHERFSKELIDALFALVCSYLTTTLNLTEDDKRGSDT